MGRVQVFLTSLQQSDFTPAGSVPSGRAARLGKWCVVRVGIKRAEICNVVVDDPTARVSARISLSIRSKALTWDFKVPSAAQRLGILFWPVATSIRWQKLSVHGWDSLAVPLSVAASVSSSIPEILSCIQLNIPPPRLAREKKKSHLWQRYLKGGWKWLVKGNKRTSKILGQL